MLLHSPVPYLLPLLHVPALSVQMQGFLWQGGVAADGEKVADIHAVFTKDALSGEGIVLKKGKKNFRKVVVK